MGILTKVKVAVARRKLNSMDIIGTDSLEKLIHSRFLADFKKSQELRDMIGKILLMRSLPRRLTHISSITAIIIKRSMKRLA